MWCAYTNQMQLNSALPFISPGRKQLQEFLFDRVGLNSLRSLLLVRHRFLKAKGSLSKRPNQTLTLLRVTPVLYLFSLLAVICPLIQANYYDEHLKAQRNISSLLSGVKLRLCFFHHFHSLLMCRVEEAVFLFSVQKPAIPLICMQCCSDRR